jgi:signal transduction histidine kinase/CheY-like chemotaxis protein
MPNTETPQLAKGRDAALLVGIAAVYFVAGKVGLDFFGLLNPSASAVWPPTGVAIASLLLYGYRAAGAVFVGAFLVNYTTAGGVLASLGIAVGNTLEGVVAAYLVTRFANGAAAFERAGDLAKYAALAAVVSTTVSATIGVGILSLAGLAAPETVGGVWLTWWLGDAAGAILVAPLIVLWFRERGFTFSAARVAEAALLGAAAIAVTAVLFVQDYPIGFLCTPVLVWAAFRFREREVATTAACISTVATWATVTGHGQFVMATPNESLLVLQAFTAGVTLMALMMSALVQERLALLERERAALAEAEAALRSSDAFLAMLSHELRNPLSAIAAAGATLEQPRISAEWNVRAGQIIRRQTALLKRLIDDLLDVAKITGGKLALVRRPVDLAELVATTVQSLADSGGRARPPVDLQLSRVFVDGDPERIQQVIANLVGNAIKFTPPSGHVRLRTFAEGREAVLRVEDSGAGIAPDVLPRVFDLFQQGVQGRDRSRGGLGVGLTIVRRIVEMHGGTVDARSDGEGRGSVFTVRLPSTPEPAAVAAPKSVAARAIAAQRILLIEDNADARETLRMVLENVGHDLLEAADGESGVERAISLRPRLALVDIGLPGIDGCEVAKRIRSVDPSIRLVALTGYGRDEDLAASRAAGFDAHLVKPVSVEQLGALIERLLG